MWLKRRAGCPIPLLPDTKAEVAVPITQGNQVLGVLDVQHNVVEGLGKADVELLQSIAGQVAIALQNASLLARHEEALVAVQEEQERVQTILGSITTPTLISSVADGLVLYVNEPLTEMIRVPAEELLGEVTPDFYANPADRAPFLSQIREHGFVDNYEINLKRGDGEVFWALVSGRVINYQGLPALLTSLVDIDNRKQAEATLAKQANQLAAVAEVSTVTATILEPERLLQQAVDLTKNRFNLYHAHIHLIDANRENLVLTAGADEIGRQMVAEGRRIPFLAKGSLVATTARNNEGAIRHYDSGSEGFMPHPLLADTRTELAVPLAIGHQVLGVLDVRSTEINGFQESDITLFHTLATQIAVALQNARTFASSEAARKNLDEITRRLTREGWQNYMDTLSSNRQFSYGSAFQELDNGHVDSAANVPLKRPLQVQGETIGEFILDTPSQINEEETADIIEAVAEQLSHHIENLRLTEQTQEALAMSELQAHNLTVLNEMSQRLNQTTRVSEIMEIINEYLQQLVSHDRASVALVKPNSNVAELVAVSGLGYESKVGIGTEMPIADILTEDLIQNEIVVTETLSQDSYLAQQGIQSTINAILRTSSGPIGSLNIGAKRQKVFTDQDKQVLRQIASILSTNIEARTLFEQAQKRAAELETVAEVSTAASTILQSEQLLQSVADLVKERFGHYHAHIYLLDEKTASLKLAAGAGEVGRQMTDEGWQILLTRPQSLVVRTARTAEGIIVNNVFEDPDYLPNPLLPNTQSEMATPMVVGDQVIGVLDVQSDQTNAFTNEDIQIHTTLAAQVAVAVQNARQYEQTQVALAETRRAAQRMALLTQISEKITTADSLDEIYELAANEATQLFPSDRVTLSLLDDSGEKAQVIALGGDRGSVPVGVPQPIAGSLTEKAVQSRKAVVIHDPNPDPKRSINSSMIVPLISGTNVLGTINIGSKRLNLYDAQDETLTFQMASLLSAAIENQSLYAEQEATVKRLRELDELKSSFLANMSHELRTPLNSVIGFTDVMLEGLDGPLTDDMETDLKIIQSNGHHLLNLINEILDMAKIEAGRMELDLQQVNLHDMLNDVVAIASPLAREKELGLSLNTMGDRDEFEVEGDNKRIKQVLLNLTSNAIKFTANGQVNLEIERFDDIVQIRVQDTGAGIPPDHLERIFEAFRQADNSATRKAGGTGLGLPISRRLVELHGGRLWVESVVDVGSTFFIELPVEVKRAAQPELNVEMQ